MAKKIRRKLLSIVLMLAMVTSLSPGLMLPALAVATPGSTTMESASEVYLGVATEINVNWSGDSNKNYFKFTATVSGNYTISLTGGSDTIYYTVYNSGGGELTSQNGLALEYGTDPLSVIYTIGSAGVYYIDVYSDTEEVWTLTITPPGPTAPTVTAQAATDVTSAGATMNGTVNANGASTSVTFQYGLTASYEIGGLGATQNPVTGYAATPVSATKTGLMPNTTYHFRLVGANSAGTTYGSDFTFTTNVAPTVSSINRTEDAAVMTGTESVTYRVTFSGAVTGVDAGDFALTKTGTANGTISSVSAAGSAVIDVTVISLSGDGTIRLDLNSSGTGITDAVGTVISGGFTSGQTYTLDATVPSAPSTPDLSAGSDTGLSGDDITNDTTPTFSGTAEANSTVTLYDIDGTTVLGTDTAVGGNWTITTPTLTPGAHTVTAKATDAAGNTGVASSGLVITIDTSAPSAPSAPNLDAASDTGTSDTDDLTNDTTPTFSGMAEANSTVKLFDTDGSTVIWTGTADAGGSWSITAPTLADGAHTVTAKATDMAGNVSTASVGLDIVVQTAAPTVTSVSVPADGAYKADYNLDFTVIWNKIVTVDKTGGTPTIGVNIGGTPLSATYVSGSGTSALVFRYTVQAGDIDMDGISVGTLSLNGGTVCDAAGNGATLTLNNVGSTTNVLVDTIAPTVTDGNISISGANGTGGVFKIGDTVTATWNNTAGGDGNGDIASVMVNFSSFGGTAVIATNSSGTWTATYTIIPGSIVGTDLNVSVTATDLAGNITTAADTTNAAADNTMPSTPSAPDMDAASDTGASDTDNITNDITPTFSGTAEANITVKLYDTDGITVLGTAVADSSGNWSITVSAPIIETHTVKARTTDLAGNVSAASTGLTINADAVVPPPPSTPDMAEVSDTGSFSTDNLTNDTTPTFTGTAEANSTVTLYDMDGSTVIGTGTADGAGNWSITASVPGSGAHIITSKSTDAAGNVSAASMGLVITIDPATPGAPSLPDMATGSDSGLSSTDNVTNDKTPTFTGMGEPSSTITLYDTDGTTVLGTATTDGSGNWSVTVSLLADGDHTIAVKATDLAGNTSAASSGLAINIVTSAPAVSSVSVPADGAYKEGSSLSFTVNWSRDVNVTGTPYIALVVGATTHYADYASGSGTSALIFNYTVQAGDLDSNGITVGALTANGGTISDAAGNNATLTLNSIGNTAPVLVDTTAPMVDSVSVPSNGTYKEGQNLSFTVNWNENVTVTGTPSIELTVGATTRSAVCVSGTGTSTLVFHYTVQAGDIDSNGIAVGTLALNGGAIRDAAGNGATLTLNSVGITAAILVDAVAPTVTEANISISGATGTSGAFKIGDTVTSTWDNTASGDNNSDLESVTVDFSAFGGGSAVAATNSSGTWTATYTIVAGDIDGTNKNVSVTVTDYVGNVTLTADATNSTVDNATPAVTADNISISGATGTSGAFNIGDTVTAVWDNTASGDNNSDVESVTVDFSAFGGGSAVAAGNSSGMWTATYTIVAGSIDGTNKNVSVTATDDAGNAKTTATTANSTVDNAAPAVTDAKISISGASGTGGAFKIGDTVTATWNNTASGDNNSDTISSVTVDFSPFGGGSAVVATNSSGTWTATYTIVAGGIDGSDLNVSVTATDNAGNAKTTADTTGATTDSVAPEITGASVATDNSYVDVTFSEGVYGADDGTTALTAAKLSLTFAQNDGTAANAVISSVRKVDNTAEASATALTGGETAVRVFIIVTGTPSGDETIEIKPANASSVYDLSGNVMATDKTTGAKTFTTPVPSGGTGPSSGGAQIIVNGESRTAGTSETSINSNGQTVTTVTLDAGKLSGVLESQEDGATVIIPVSGGADVAAGVLTGQMVRSMEEKEATLIVQTPAATYTLPASGINIGAISEQFGANVSLSDIAVTVEIARPSAEMMAAAESAAAAKGCSIVIPALNFTANCSFNGQTVEVSSFSGYVERMIALPDGVDPGRITTGVVVGADGTIRHVPTDVTVIDGKYYARINSLTNSSYTVVWHPVEFSDVVNHWAKDAVNDMGSRMVVAGVRNNCFEPDRNMTRAEFAVVIVRALGLAPGNGPIGFGDVSASDWYCGYIGTAARYGIINGYRDGAFGPNDLITREQAMSMISRAMKIAGLDAVTADGDISRLLGAYADGASVSDYARGGIAACLQAGIVSGRENGTIAPQDYITRAEVAAMAERLLCKSGLI